MRIEGSHQCNYGKNERQSMDDGMSDFQGLFACIAESSVDKNCCVKICDTRRSMSMASIHNLQAMHTYNFRIERSFPWSLAVDAS